MGQRPKIRVNKGRERLRCPFCHDDLGTTLERTACQSCEAWHHTECWDENGACSGCGYVRPGQTPTRRATPQRLAANRHLCSHPGCAVRLANPLVVPHLCPSHTREARERNARLGADPASLAALFGVVGFVCLLPSVIVLALVMEGRLPWPIGVAGVGGVYALLALIASRMIYRARKRRIVEDGRRGGRRAPTRDTPPPDYR